MIFKKNNIKNFYQLFSCVALSLYVFGSIFYLYFSGPLWRDEIATISFGSAKNFKEFIDLFRYNTIPVAMPIVVKTIGLFSAQWEAYKNIAVLIGISPVFFIGAIMIKNNPRQSAYLCLLLVLLWQNIRWLNSLRAYGIGLLSLLIFMYYLQIANRDKQWSWVILLSSLFAAATSYQNWPFIASALGIHCFFSFKKPAMEKICHLWAFAAFLLVVLLHFPVLISSNKVFQTMKFPEIGPSDILRRWCSVFWMVNPYGTSVLVAFVAFCVFLFLLKQVNNAIKPDSLRLFLIMFCGTILSFGLLVSSKLVLYEWQFVLPMVFIGFQASLLLTSLVIENTLEKILLVAALILPLVPVQRPLNYLFQRCTNLDQVADLIQQNNSESDIVIVNPWEPVISFAYYYKGPCEIISVPPISKYDTHRVDEIQNTMAQPVEEIFKGIDRKITQTMKNGGRIWLLGEFAPPNNGHPPLSLELAPSLHWGWRSGPYYQMWSEHLATILMTRASSVTRLNAESDGTHKISAYEHCQVLRFETK